MTDSDNIRELLSRPTVNLCPGCKSILGSRQCHFTYSTWNCFGGCGAVLDSRAVSPILAFKCMNDFPDYQPRLGEPVHPLACSCTGRGWYPITDSQGAGETMSLLGEWFQWWQDADEAPAKMPNALHIRTSMTLLEAGMMEPAGEAACHRNLLSDPVEIDLDRHPDGTPYTDEDYPEGRQSK